MSLRVLVVEDDKEIRALVQSALALEGFEVQTAVSLSEAQALVQHSPPELIVLDLGLPDGEGLQLVQEVRRLSSLPIVVISARHQEAQKIAEFRDLGMKHFVAGLDPSTPQSIEAFGRVLEIMDRN